MGQCNVGSERQLDLGNTIVRHREGILPKSRHLSTGLTGNLFQRKSIARTGKSNNHYTVKTSVFDFVGGEIRLD